MPVGPSTSPVSSFTLILQWASCFFLSFSCRYLITDCFFNRASCIKYLNAEKAVLIPLCRSHCSCKRARHVWMVNMLLSSALTEFLLPLSSQIEWKETKRCVCVHFISHLDGFILHSVLFNFYESLVCVSLAVCWKRRRRGEDNLLCLVKCAAL